MANGDDVAAYDPSQSEPGTISVGQGGYNMAYGSPGTGQTGGDVSGGFYDQYPAYQFEGADAPAAPATTPAAGGGLNQWLYGGTADTPSTPSTPSGSQQGGSLPGGIGQTAVTSKTATKPMPALGTTPAYQAPAYDESKVTAYTQQEAALGISEWRTSLNTGLSKIMSEGNFATRADQMRKLFEGAGTGLANILQGATNEAVQRYQIEYNAAVQQALIQHEDEVRQAYTQFQADLQNYFQTMQSTTQTIGATGAQPAALGQTPIL